MSEDDRIPADPALDPEVARAASRLAPRRSLAQNLGVLGIGWAIAICIVGGFLAGLWLDGRFGTSPLLTIVGVLVGLVLTYLVGRDLVKQSRG